MKIQTVSSRWTFLFKMALPLLWLIIMGGLSILIAFSPLDSLKGPVSPMTAKLLVISLFFSILAMLYIFYGRAKWVGMTDSYLYVSNFFKSYKYTYDSVERFEEVYMVFFTKVVIHFHQPTKFGKSIYFVKSLYWKYFLEKHPMVLDAMSGKRTGDEVITESENM